MSQKIVTLPQELANQIAAGEVVERPVSVVKELVENSVDAGATSIKIRLKNGGIDLIEVSDNGTGISEIDLPKALEKYSTSKITNLKDLQEVMTFGFRGEALASISSVSQFTLNSHTSDVGAGKSLKYHDSEFSQVQDIAHERGTTILVEDLFYNTPARLNYLKTPRTEYLKIQEFLQKMALVYPGLEFTLTHDDKQTLHFPKNQDLKTRIYEIYGEEFSENLLELHHEFAGITLSGVISDPKVSFHNKTKQVLFVNKRIINSPLIFKALIDAYNRYIAPKTFPGFVLSIDLDPTQVDVNVHPRKMELRFASEQNLFRSVYHGIQNTLERVSLVQGDSLLNSGNQNSYLNPYSLQEQGATTKLQPHFSGKGQGENERSDYLEVKAKQKIEGVGASGGNGMRAGNAQKYHTSSGTKFKNYSPYTDIRANPSQGAIDFSKSILGENIQSHFSLKGESGMRAGDLRQTPLGKIIGQVHNAYILVETQEGVQMLDQHAVAERVIYEKLAKKSYTPISQKILGGISLKLTISEQEIFENTGEIFHSMGFDIETLSHGIISLQSIPDFMKRENIEKAFRNILGDITSVGSKSLDEIRHKIWAYTACRSAVKFGDPLSIFEMQALLRDASLDYSATCPHGRPVVYEIDLENLQKKYER